jgi:hypothetical protein
MEVCRVLNRLLTTDSGPHESRFFGIKGYTRWANSDGQKDRAWTGGQRQNKSDRLPNLPPRLKVRLARALAVNVSFEYTTLPNQQQSKGRITIPRNLHMRAIPAAAHTGIGLLLGRMVFPAHIVACGCGPRYDVTGVITPSVRQPNEARRD